VQLIQPANEEAPVTRLLGPGERSGEWTITTSGAAGDTVLVVSGLAPVTTEPARLTLELVAEYSACAAPPVVGSSGRRRLRTRWRLRAIGGATNAPATAP